MPIVLYKFIAILSASEFRQQLVHGNNTGQGRQEMRQRRDMIPKRCERRGASVVGEFFFLA